MKTTIYLENSDQKNIKDIKKITGIKTKNKTIREALKHYLRYLKCINDENTP